MRVHYRLFQNNFIYNGPKQVMKSSNDILNNVLFIIMVNQNIFNLWFCVITYLIRLSPYGSVAAAKVQLHHMLLQTHKLS